MDLGLTDGGADVLMMLCFGIPQEIRNYMSFEEALAAASREDGFKATVYAMNTLLVRKGVYTQEEFQIFFVEWVEKELKRKKQDGEKSRSE